MFTTADDCYRYVLQGVRKNNAGTITPTQFNRYFVGAQRRFVDEAYTAVDRDQLHMDVLRVLTPAPLVIANSGLNAPEQESFDLPYVQNPPSGASHGYQHMLSVGLKIARLVNGQPQPVACADPSGWTLARILRRDSRYANESNPFWRPSEEEPYYYLVGNTMRVKAGPDTFATSARIEYLRYPVDVSVNGQIVDPELPSAVNRMICDRLITDYLESSESPRTATHNAIRQDNI